MHARAGEHVGARQQGVLLRCRRLCVPYMSLWARSGAHILLSMRMPLGALGGTHTAVHAHEPLGAQGGTHIAGHVHGHGHAWGQTLRRAS